MPLRKPKKGESQSDFMAYCMHELSTESATDRPQEQMVAICLSAWREEHGGSPPAKADITGWMARLKDILDELQAKTSIKIDQVWIPGEMGEDGLPVNYGELLQLLEQQDNAGAPKEPKKPEEAKPTVIVDDAVH